MTVCIAAICDCGHKVVVAADRMFTFPAPLNIEFQTPEKKIEQIGTSCVVLSSGNGAYSTEITQAVTRLLNGNPNPPISRAAEILRDAYLQIRSIKVREQVIIAMLGPDYLKFEAMNVSLPQYLQYQPAVFQQAAVQMQMFNLGTDMIVAGVDAEGARVAYVGNPGTLAWLDKLGYAAIGSGGIHATTRLSLGSQTRDSGLAETVYRVYEAKRAAEVAPGVGPETLP
jgi:20S proteasome alpha/beta subunit